MSRVNNMLHVDVTSQENASLNILIPNAPSFGEQPQNLDREDEIKLEHSWASSLSGHGDRPRIDETPFEPTNVLSLDNVNTNTSNPGIDSCQSFPQRCNLNDFPQKFGQNVGNVSTSNQALEAGMCCPCNSGLLESNHVLCPGGSLSTCESSSRGAGTFSEEGEDRPGDSLDGWRLSRKRQNIGGVPEQASPTGSSTLFPQHENSLLDPGSSHYNDDPGLSISRSSAASDLGNAERLPRSVRIRINPADQHAIPPSTLWAPGNTTTRSTVQTSSLSIPFTQSLESGPVVPGASSDSQFHVPGTLLLPLNAQQENEASNSIISGSPTNPSIRGERLTPITEEANFWDMLNRSSSGNPALLAETETLQSVTVQPSQNLPNGTACVPDNVARSSVTSSSSGVHQLRSPTMTPHESPPAPQLRYLSETYQLTSHGSSASGGQDMNAPQQAILLPQTTANREIRSKMRFENVRHFDRYPYVGDDDLLDRHRDMRLDVDNMSYEDLLALEEQMGVVNTGLSEETVMKHLKQRKYVAVTVEASAEVEPCCICQEEYSDGQNLGTPDCDHEFHTACIKEWLMQKNLCPICKTTALATTASENEGDMQHPQTSDVASTSYNEGDSQSQHSQSSDDEDWDYLCG